MKKSHCSVTSQKRYRLKTRYVPHIGWTECQRRRFQRGTGEFAGVLAAQARAMRAAGAEAHRERLDNKRAPGKILNRMIRGF